MTARRRLLAAVPVALAVAVAAVPAADPVADPPKPPAGRPVRIGEYTVRLRPNPASAVALAAADAARLPPAVAPLTRYLWVEDGDPLTMKALSLAVNYTNHADLPTRPTPVAGPDGTLLLRVHLAAYTRSADQLERFLTLWEDYRFDPKFSLLVTQDTLKLLNLDKVPVVKIRRKVRREQIVGHKPGAVRTEKRTIAHPGGDFHYPDGSGRVNRDLAAGSYVFDLEFREKGEPIFEAVTADEVAEVRVEDVKDVPVVRLPSPGLDQAAYAALCQRLRTEAPVLSGSYWMCRHLSTVKEDGLFAELYGGRYYEFMLYKRGQKKGTDEDHIFAGLGLGNVDAGETAERVYDKVRSDQRVAIFESEVTGKPRRADFLRTPTNRSGTGLLSVTHDLVVRDIDIGTHPLMNLQRFRDAGREGIYEKADGLHGFYITDGTGSLQDVAPQALVEDHDVPAPHTKYLQCAISCIGCHGKGADDGWKPTENDARAILQSPRGDVFADLADRSARADDTLRRIAGQYMGDPERKVLPRGRSDYADAVLAATGPWPGTTNTTSVVKLSAARLRQVWNDRNYARVTPRQALFELGVAADERDARGVLDLLLPPTREPGSIFKNGPEDPRLQGLLAKTKGIKRADWDLYYGFAAGRAAATLSRLNPPTGGK